MFAKFLHLPLPLSSALEISRSYGVGWALFGQGRYQLDGALAQGIDINARNKITFTTSPGDAKELARHSITLTAEDIQALPKHEIYANVVADGTPSGWFSARTLPPPTRLGHGSTIREAARSKHGAGGSQSTPDATSKPDVDPPVAPASDSFVRRRKT